MFLGNIVLQLFCMYSLCYVLCYFACEICIIIIIIIIIIKGNSCHVNLHILLLP